MDELGRLADVLWCAQLLERVYKRLRENNPSLTERKRMVSFFVCYFVCYFVCLFVGLFVLLVGEATNKKKKKKEAEIEFDSLAATSPSSAGTSRNQEDHVGQLCRNRQSVRNEFSNDNIMMRE